MGRNTSPSVGYTVALLTQMTEEEFIVEIDKTIKDTNKVVTYNQ